MAVEETLEFGLPPEVVERLRRVFADVKGLERVVVYGSRAKGNYRSGSDVDLTLMGDRLSYAQLVAVEMAIDDLMLPYRFDLSLYSHIDNPDLLKHISRVGRVFYPAESA